MQKSSSPCKDLLVVGGFLPLPRHLRSKNLAGFALGATRQKHLSWEEDAATRIPASGKATGVLPTWGEATEKRDIVPRAGEDQLHPSEIRRPSAALGGIACTSGAHACLTPLNPLPVPQFPCCSLTVPVVAQQELGAWAWAVQQ